MTHQTDALYLLIGGNPLPNAAAALALLSSSGTPYLIHTKQTQLQAQRLATALAVAKPSLKPAQLINLEDNQAEASIIASQIRASAQTLQGSIGLNYTGGNKAMSVHAYRAISQLHPNAVFSYLDSQTQEIIIDNNDRKSDRLKCTIPLSFEALFALHGLQWRKDRTPVETATLPIAAAHLAHHHQNELLHKAWRKWCEQTLKAKTQTNQYKPKWLSESQLEMIAPISIQSLPRDLKQWCQTYLDANTIQLSLQVAKTKGFQSITQLCEWLNGIWMENHVLAEIERIADKHKIHDRGMSFHIQDPNRIEAADKFESDVAFMQSYHLFYFSCTTSADHKLCKQKLMEAKTRAQQLGGTEARIALVCCSDYPDRLRDELDIASSKTHQRKDPKIKVFGRQDLHQLGNRMTQWLNEFK
jgi:hypothetical protein